MSKKPSRFHVNKKGEIAPCEAMSSRCPYIDFSDESFGHYRTEAEMEEYLERKVSLGSLNSDTLDEDKFYRTDLPELLPTEKLSKHKIFVSPGDALNLSGDIDYSQEDINRSIEARAVYMLARTMEMEGIYLKESLRSPYESLSDYKELAATALYATDTGKANLDKIFSVSQYSECLGIRREINPDKIEGIQEKFSAEEFLGRFPENTGEEKGRDLRRYTLLSIESSKKLSRTPHEFNAVAVWTSGGPMLAASYQGNKDKASLVNQHGRLSKKDLESYMNLVNQAVVRATPTLKEGESLPKVYKGINPEKFHTDYGIEIESILQDSSGDLSALEGETLDFKTPSSTSVSKDVATGFGSVVLEIQPKHAAFVGAQSSWGFREEEALLAGNTRYRIKKARKEESAYRLGTLVLELEEIEGGASSTSSRRSRKVSQEIEGKSKII